MLQIERVAPVSDMHNVGCAPAWARKARLWSSFRNAPGLTSFGSSSPPRLPVGAGSEG